MSESEKEMEGHGESQRGECGRRKAIEKQREIDSQREDTERKCVFERERERERERVCLRERESVCFKMCIQRNREL